MAGPKTTLMQRTQAAIRAYNADRARLVREAAASGGPEAAAALEEEFQALCNAAFALQRAALKRNHRRYGALLAEAGEGVLEARRLMDEGATFLAVLDGMGKAVTLLGRALLLLGK